MDFSINPLAYTNIFSLPKSVVDDNIRLASVVQLKVLLYMFRYNGERSLCAEDIADALSLDKADVTDAMIFWNDRNMLLKSGESPKNVENPVTKIIFEKSSKTVAEEKAKAEIEKLKEEPKAENATKLNDLPISKPSFEQISARLKESEELRGLLLEAQLILGKTIGYDGQSVLIMLMDSYGLPAEIILMAIEYSVSMGKASFSNIAKIGKKWGELEIDNIDSAEEYIKEHTIVDEAWEKFRSLTEINNRRPTEKQRKFFVAWVKEYGYDAEMLYYAYEESIDRTGKFNMPYMDKIVKGWHDNGVKTPTDIQRIRDDWKEQHEKLSGKKSDDQNEAKEASYDLDEFSKKAIGITYKKKTDKVF